MFYNRKYSINCTCLVFISALEHESIHSQFFFALVGYGYGYIFNYFKMM